ncbi:HAD family hydrolase [Thalassotalea maritima]|uniref:HAD family hydrolase n=1 Tax=Thalassotalea maritima TaxID=3242416 RepID=UPI0035293865
MHHYQLYIFDWDGTLMDSIGKIVTSLQHAASEADLPVPSIPACKRIIGAGLHDACDILFPNASNRQLHALQQAYRQHFISFNQVASPMFKGSIELLEALQDKDKKLAIATSKGRYGLEEVLSETKLTDFFHCLRCADDAKAKPDPDMLEQILTTLSIEREQAVYIGDSRYDIDMAHNAGIDSIAITHGAGHIDELNQRRPTRMVHSVSELSKLVIG